MILFAKSGLKHRTTSQQSMWHCHHIYGVAFRTGPSAVLMLMSRGCALRYTVHQLICWRCLVVPIHLSKRVPEARVSWVCVSFPVEIPLSTPVVFLLNLWAPPCIPADSCLHLWQLSPALYLSHCFPSFPHPPLLNFLNSLVSWMIARIGK